MYVGLNATKIDDNFNGRLCNGNSFSSFSFPLLIMVAPT